MTHLPWLAQMVVEIAWPGLAVLAAIALLSRVPALRRRSPRTSSVVALLLAPAALLLYAATLYAHSAGVAPGEIDLVQGVFLALVGLGVAWVAYLAWRERRASWWWLMAAAALAMIDVIKVTWFIGSMALVNDWL